jgi:curved DNA-binding protein CbpA
MRLFEANCPIFSQRSRKFIGIYDIFYGILICRYAAQTANKEAVARGYREALSSKDYYKILQIDPAADPEIIAVAYKRLARKYHPDTNGSLDATLRMQEINAAYQVLRDPVKRAQYDRERSFHSSRSNTREEEARRKQEETGAALRRAKEAAEAAQRRAEEERRKREAAEAAQRHTEEERRKREAAEAAQRHAKAPQLWWGLPRWVLLLSLLGVLITFSWLSTPRTNTTQVAPLPPVRYNVSLPAKPDYQPGAVSQPAETQAQTAEHEQLRSQEMKHVALQTRSAVQESKEVQSEPSAEQTQPPRPTSSTQTTPSKPSTILNGLNQRSEPSRSQSRGNVGSISDFFTIGSTKDEVLAVQGTPDRLPNDAFHYGLSDVFFQNGRVVRWDNRTSTLKVSLEPARATPPSFFPAGSTKNKESATQGTPDKFRQDSLMSTYAMDQKAKDIERAQFWKQHGYDFNPDDMTAYAMDQKVKDVERAKYWKARGLHFDPNDMTAYAMDQEAKLLLQHTKP